MLSILKIALVAALVALSGLASLAVAWMFGYVSRPVAMATSPDGRIEAVCRGRLPESTEYDLWFREPGEVFGRRAGLVGSETMGKCRAVAWSPGGEVVATLSEAGTIGVFDGRSARALGFQHLPGPDGNYPPRQMVTSLDLVSPAVVTFEQCARQWRPLGRHQVVFECASAPVRRQVTLDLEPPRGAFGR